MGRKKRTAENGGKSPVLKHSVVNTHIQLSTKCTNKGPLGRGVSRGLRTRVFLSSKKDPIYGVSSEKGRLLFREWCYRTKKHFFSRRKHSGKHFPIRGTLVYIFIEYKYISVHDISSPTYSVHYGTFLLLALKDYNI